MSHSLSRPKEKIKILLLEGISETAVNTFKGAGYSNVEVRKGALDGAELKKALKGVSMLGIRSRTKLTAEALDGVRSLIAVGCFSVGTNQVDLVTSNHMGLPVFNAPFSNTRSVAQLTIAEIVMLYRRIFPKSVSAHAGGWEKSAEGSREIRGKVLGIIGYGNIGSQLAMLAEAMGMRVLYYDRTDKLRHGNVEPVDSLDELLAVSDVISIHVPETPETKGMIGEAQLRAMKPGAFSSTTPAAPSSIQKHWQAHSATSIWPVQQWTCFPVEPASNAGALYLAAPSSR